MLRASFLGCVLAAAVAPAPAHASDWKIQYSPVASVPAAGLALSPIAFVDERDPDRGRGENNRVGVVRAGAGFPYPLKSKGLPIDALLVAFVTDALHAEGFAPGTSGPAMAVVAEEFWIDGYMTYTLRVGVRVEVTRPGAPAWTWGFADEASESLEWSYSEFDKPLAAILQRQRAALRAAVDSDAFRAAVGAPAKASAHAEEEPGAPADAPLAIPADAGGCGKDTDCKGERICEKRKCVDP